MNRRPFSPMDFQQAVSRTHRRKIDPIKLPVWPFFLAGMVVAGIGFYVLSTML